MKELYNYSILLNFLYGDEVRYVEEISVIERMYLYPDIGVYVDQYNSPSRFFITQFNDNLNSCFVYIESQKDENFVLDAIPIIKSYSKVHIQCGDFEKDILKKYFIFSYEFEYLIMKFQKENFKPCYIPKPILLTADISQEEMDKISGGNSYRYREEIRHGVFYGFKDKKKWICLGGCGIRSKNCRYMFIETNYKYRGRGLAYSVLSYAIRRILDEGKEPVYALDLQNEPSMKIGYKLGFVSYVNLKCLFLGPWRLFRREYDKPNIPDSSFLF